MVCLDRGFGLLQALTRGRQIVNLSTIDLECVSSFCNVVLAWIVRDVIFAWTGFVLNMVFRVKDGFCWRMTFGFERKGGREV